MDSSIEATSVAPDVVAGVIIDRMRSYANMAQIAPGASLKAGLHRFNTPDDFSMMQYIFRVPQAAAIDYEPPR